MEVVVVFIFFLILVAMGVFFVLLRKNEMGKGGPASSPTPSPLEAPLEKKSILRKSLLSWLPLLESKSKDLAKWEQVLIESDMGPKLTNELLSGLKTTDLEPAIYLKTQLHELIRPAESLEEPWKQKNPWVLFIVGVNGVGKTTTLVKLAHFFMEKNLSVGVIGADTFRKAAVEQLERGIQNLGAEFFTLTSGDESEGADPSAVVFDGLRKFKDKNIILVDTSGRLHTKKNLMDELTKMKKVATKSMEGAPHDLWLIIDSTLGQNTVPQAKAFHEAVGLTGMVLTKVDGLSRGGTIFQLFQQLRLPIRFFGVGEGAKDLKPFKSSIFVEELFDHSSPSS